MPPKKIYSIDEHNNPETDAFGESSQPAEGDMVKIKKRILTPQALEKLAIARQKAHEVVRTKGRIARQIREERGVVASKLAKQYIEEGILKPNTNTTKGTFSEVATDTLDTKKDTITDTKADAKADTNRKSKPIKVPLTGVKKIVKKKVIYYTDEPDTDATASGSENNFEEEIRKVVPTPVRTRKPTTRNDKQQQQRQPSNVDKIISSFY